MPISESARVAVLCSRVNFRLRVAVCAIRRTLCAPAQTSHIERCGGGGSKYKRNCPV